MAAALDPFAMFRQLDPGQVFLQRGMRARLADEQEMPIRRLSRNYDANRFADINQRQDPPAARSN